MTREGTAWRAAGRAHDASSATAPPTPATSSVSGPGQAEGRAEERAQQRPTSHIPPADAAADSAELEELLWHWGSAYGIYYACGQWTARYLGEPGTLSAGSADELRQLIRADYNRRTVLRQSGGGVTEARNAMGAGERALRGLVDEGLI
jgi:hypothetical protein